MGAATGAGGTGGATGVVAGGGAAASLRPGARPRRRRGAGLLVAGLVGAVLLVAGAAFALTREADTAIPVEVTTTTTSDTTTTGTPTRTSSTTRSTTTPAPTPGADPAGLRLRGVELGYPTANVPTTGVNAAPADGVYAGWLFDEAGTRWPVAISVGSSWREWPTPWLARLRTSV